MSLSEVLRAASLSCATVLTLFMSTLAQAMAPEQASGLLANLHQLRVESYLAINAYYNFANSNGDKSIAAEANSTINRIDGLLKQVAAVPEATEVQADLTRLNEQWKRYRGLLDTNLKDIVKLGYPDLRLTVEMGQANIDFVAALSQTGDNVKKVSNYQPAAMVELTREATIKIEQMMTAYAARTASNVSQVAQGADTDIPIDQMAKEFSDQLEKMRTASAQESETLKLVDGIITKWNFIKGSYINYHENNVSYVSNLYSKRIIESLQQLESSFAKL